MLTIKFHWPKNYPFCHFSTQNESTFWPKIPKSGTLTRYCMIRIDQKNKVCMFMSLNYMTLNLQN